MKSLRIVERTTKMGPILMAALVGVFFALSLWRLLRAGINHDQCAFSASERAVPVGKPSEGDPLRRY